MITLPNRLSLISIYLDLAVNSALILLTSNSQIIELLRDDSVPSLEDTTTMATAIKTIIEEDIVDFRVVSIGTKYCLIDNRIIVPTKVFTAG